MVNDELSTRRISAVCSGLRAWWATVPAPRHGSVGDVDVYGTVNTNLRINERGIQSRCNTDRNWCYPLELAGANFAPMAANTFRPGETKATTRKGSVHAVLSASTEWECNTCWNLAILWEQRPGDARYVLLVISL